VARKPSSTEINVACRVLTGGSGQSRKQTFPFGEFLFRCRLRASVPSYIIGTLVPCDEATFAKSERCVEAVHAGTDSQRNFINDRQLINDRHPARLARPRLIAAVALPPSRHAPPSAGFETYIASLLPVKSFGTSLLLLMRTPCERADRRVS